ncbi:uncharacterized protein LOC132038431 [Lycium ferocissimum]|uniref:uncharacterized protein LOC132038431 n=1 Tax=Lycium ferocissimum TaxID=112874 RepID=UPI0028149AD6|nr:uncharacterized protein LOC132038431 [Lycium ferocissimum]
MRATEYKYSTSTATPHPATRMVNIKWYPPLPGYLKLNIDGAHSSTTHKGGIGGVFRDHYGNWILGFYQANHCLNHTMAELLALLQGLQLAWEKLYSCGSRNRFSGGTSFTSKASTGSPAVRHNFRQGNKVADLLSKHGLKYGNYDQPTILLSPPTSVTTLLEAEKQGVTTAKVVSLASYNSLTSLGNLSVLAVNDSMFVPSSSYVTP